MGRYEAENVAQRWREMAVEAVVLDGFHALKHALRFGVDVRLAITDDKASLLKLAAALADDVAEWIKASVIEVPAPSLQALMPRLHPTRVAALAARPSTEVNRAALTRQPRLSPVVVLDHPRNLGNVGAVIRLAAGFGATGVITTGTLDPWHPNVVRASAGLHFATAVERLSLSELSSGPLYALDPGGEDIQSLTIPDNALLAFGSERQGISPELRDHATKLVSIPMRPHVSSFNLATTVAMALFHWLPAPAAQTAETDEDERSTPVM